MSKFKAIISIGAELGSSVKGAFTSASSEAKKLGKELEKINQASTLVGQTKVQERAVRDAERDLNKKIALQRKAAALSAKYPNEKEARREATRLAAEVKKATSAVDKEYQALHKLDDQLKKAGVDTKNLSKEQERLRQAALKTSEQFDRSERSAQKIHKIGDAFKTLNRRAVAVGIAITALVGATIYTGKKVYDFEKNYLSRLSDTTSVAHGLGVTTRALVGMRLAAASTGIEAGKLDSILEQLKEKAEGAKNGKGKAADAWRALRINPGRFAKLDPEQQLKEFAIRVQNYDGKMDIAVVLTRLLGAEASKLFAVLKKGPGVIDEFAAKGEKLGLSPTEEMKQRADELGKAFATFGGTVEGVFNRIGDALAPVFTNYLNKFSDWVDKNPDKIEHLGNVISEMAERAVQKGEKIIDCLVDLTSYIDDADLAFGVLAAVSLAPVITTVGLATIAVGNLAKALNGAWATYSMFPWVATGAGLLFLENQAGRTYQKSVLGDAVFGKNNLPTEEKIKKAGELKKELEKDTSKNAVSRFADGSFGLDLIDKVANKLGSIFGSKQQGEELAIGPKKKLEKVEERIKTLERKPTTGPINQTFNFNITTQPGQSERAVADEVGRMMKQNPALAGGYLHD